MIQLTTSGVLFVASLVSGSLTVARIAQSEEVSYNFDVKPILSDRCYHCHGPDAENQASEFRIDTQENAFADLGGYAAVVPGNVDASELHRRIWSTDDDQMPPIESHRKLSDDEKRVLDDWIKSGARFDRHWSFESLPSEFAAPNHQTISGRNEIDDFVANELQQHGYSPNREASRETLIRRVTFALTGLPPTVDEIDAFLADSSANAYENVVDRLLASPHYGERMAVDWLDLSRYADTYGYQEDRYRDVWPWRDWVVRAFNKNMPFDEFATWQLAGDLLPKATSEQVLATAFNRLHRQTSEGGSVEEEFRIEYVVDRVDTFGSVFLGLTLGCARCHDHKYDPITQRDYYQFSAFFDNIDESGLYPFFTSSVPTPTLDLADEQSSQALLELEQAVEDATFEQDSVWDTQRVAFEQWLNASPVDTNLTGLVGDFSFDDLEGKNEEEVINKADPTSNGKIAEDSKIVASDQGRAILFNGENAFSTTVGGTFRRFTPFTIDVSLKTPDEKQRAVVWHRTRASIDAGSRGYQLLIEDGKLSASVIHFWPGNAVRVRSKQSLPIGEWVRVTVTYDGSSAASGLRIYLNGQSMDVEVVRDCLTRRVDYSGESNIVDAEKVAKLAHRLVLGQRFRDRGFSGGMIESLKVFDRALAGHEVEALCNRPGYYQRLIEKEMSRTEREQQQLYEYYLRNHNEAYTAANSALLDARRTHAEFYDLIPQIMVMREMPRRRQTYVLARGAYDAPTAQVDPATPEWLTPYEADWPRNRLGLARWLTDPRQPLMSRVAVNRFWQTLFGQGIVSTPLDFGSQGNRPSHPELLDWLSREFVASGWNVKQLVKKIVMSATYRQSSLQTPEVLARDPHNVLLARGPRHRLPAEMIRDSALFASGLLVNRLGGPPVKPYQPAGLWKEKGWGSFERDPGEGSRRRSLYTHWKRTSPPPSMMTLDAPDREVCVAQRQTTATPLQPLVLLNDIQYVEAARALAESLIIAMGEDTEAQIDLAYRRCTGRHATLHERSTLEQLFYDQLTLFSSDPDRAHEFLRVGDHVSDDSHVSHKLAALTVTVQVIMNHYDSITVR
ncbi:MAG: DUF1553 domain-containing protein [Planctomycetota bacterium]